VSAPRDFSTRRRARALSRAQAAVLLLGCGALAAASAAALRAWREHGDAAARLAAVRQEAEAARARRRELQARRGPGQAMAVQALLTVDAAPPRVVAALADALPGDVRLDAISLRYGEQVDIDLRVAARTPAAFDRFLDRLQRSPTFTAVLPGDEDRRGQMRTTIRGRYRPGAP
jgi:hypothetical protein